MPTRSLDDFALRKLADLDARGLRRTLAESAREDGIFVTRDGRRLLSFSCNDYLNLTHHPAVKAAAIEAIGRYGAGAGASRLVTGNHPLFEALEARLARLKQTEAACIFGSGYLANAGIAPVFAGAGDLIVIDELAHACLWAGARLSAARTLTFRHNDAAHAADLLARHRAGSGRALLVTDGVFSMDGDLAPLPELAAICAAHDVWLLTDDAHGLGVIGAGRGSAFAARTAIPLQMGTLSKAIGGYGGYLCASKAVIDLVKTRSRTLIYSTALPPAMAGAAIAALDLIEANPKLTEAPLVKARAFTSRLGLPPAQSPIVPLVTGTPEAALKASATLAEEGFLVAAIRPPTVPQGTARLRFAFTAAHSDEDVARLAAAVQKILDPARAEPLCPRFS
ncbi:aminotransferase class I/II-fold pyridoxal phosphate-dependent enzyme [Methylocapsa palsarum]|uniref:8-amino-7-oxononanoate synthase n=1 Tax=Methylocapsa palsarum TaxID=1612308 RepID=A0A1I4AEF6_9HYPH|nr:aminotransferase class I/II-fold pyridoxal phosphate-dependent enzyme [Methylocapsa palsarum]SFK54457.1 8-amino-7-oxononanoate synthase [Methylocapsa palsarum]